MSSRLVERHRQGADVSRPGSRIALHLAVVALLGACGERLSLQAANSGPTVETVVSRGVDALDSARADSVSRARQDSINRARPDYVVDSILPPDEALRRFRSGLREVHALSDAKPSRDALVRTIIDAVERADTTTLRSLAVTPAEFAWLVYPSSDYSRPPTQHPPDLAWFMLSAGSESRLRRLVTRLGGRPLAVRGYQCAPTAIREGENRIWSDCVVRRRADGGGDVSQRLFGALIERGGRWKVLSYANDF